MEFLLLGGMILLMGLTSRIKILQEANKALIGLKLPIGVVVFLFGLSLFFKGAGKFVFPGIMGLIAGAFLILDLFKLIPQAQESIDKVTNTINAFQVPIGIITIIAALIGMF